jgi:hypothetical protein
MKHGRAKSVAVVAAEDAADVEATAEDANKRLRPFVTTRRRMAVVQCHA